MPTGFTATEMAIVDENGVLVIGLSAPSEEAEPVYLVLQRQQKSDPQDAALGMDLPHVEYCSQAWSWYGHIERFELARDRVVVTMDDGSAAAEMGNDGRIEVAFSLDEVKFAALRTSLRRVFDSQPCFVERH